MPIMFSPTIPAALQARVKATDVYKAIEANENDHNFPASTWRVEHVRELGGCLEAWLFRTVPGTTPPEKHIHITVHPDQSEETVSVSFGIEGKDRLAFNRRPHGPTSPN